MWNFPCRIRQESPIEGLGFKDPQRNPCTLHLGEVGGATITRDTPLSQRRLIDAVMTENYFMLGNEVGVPEYPAVP